MAKLAQTWGGACWAWTFPNPTYCNLVSSSNNGIVFTSRFAITFWRSVRKQVKPEIWVSGLDYVNCLINALLLPEVALFIYVM